MSDRFHFDDAFYPVPAAATDADPAEAIRQLLYRVARLEHSLEETQVQAMGDMSEVLLELVSLSDDITQVVERWGVATNAREAALVRGLVALGKKLVAILQHHQVEALSTVGMPFDPASSDIAGREVREQAPEGQVLRELQCGYTWPHGLLRRARVVVSARADEDVDAGDSGDA